jgi:membrane protease YdiL (CAAX protease family)
LRNKDWTLVDVGKVLVILFLLIVLSRLFRVDFAQTVAVSTPVRTAVVMLLVYGVLTMLVFYFAVVKYRGSSKDLGFTSFGFGHALGLAIIWLVVLRVVAIIYGIIASIVGTILKVQPPTELVTRIPQLFGYGYVGLLVAVVLGALVAPIVEELFFRGFLYPALRRRLGVAGGIVVSAVVFGLFHGNAWLIFPTFAIGMILAYLYEREGSLGPPIMLHSLNNLISIVIIYSMVIK